jgi:hypothetical protein
MAKPVYRHLAEQRWRGDGALDLLARPSMTDTRHVR